jgi:uncharacterized protein (TIGR02001 family)
MKKISIAALLVISSIGTVSSLQANDLKVSGNIGATSNYIWRGMTQTKDKSSTNGGIDLDYKGFYAGTWASNVDFGTKANYELDLYGGYSGAYNGLTYDLSYLAFMYPDSKDSSDFSEVTLALGYDIDKLSLGASYSKTVYEEWTGGTKPYYVEGTASYDFGVASLDLSYGDYENTGKNYTVGVSKSFELEGNSLDLALKYANFDSDAGNANDQKNLYATITYSF